MMRSRTISVDVCITQESLLRVIRECADSRFLYLYNINYAAEKRDPDRPQRGFCELADLNLELMMDSFTAFLILRTTAERYVDFRPYLDCRVSDDEIGGYHEFLNAGGAYLPLLEIPNGCPYATRNMFSFRVPGAEEAGTSDVFREMRRRILKICPRLAGYRGGPVFTQTCYKVRFEPGLEDYMAKWEDFNEFLK